MTALSEMSRDGLMPTLREWWSDAEHPMGLAITARKLCSDNEIDKIVSTARQFAISLVHGVSTRIYASLPNFDECSWPQNDGKTNPENCETSAASEEDTPPEESYAIEAAPVVYQETRPTMNTNGPIAQAAQVTGRRHGVSGRIEITV
ncbi:hypothetical protein HIM_09051 [Hirsutella minnesotensis 3608]|uniref:Uncharacterized protein n=1 Tax=Hirsutella minnesotensis 3608 TaxID=1043627 RepID=A0A0F7ZXZ5_9HYPO|nr:hypothetical protein HIM_09051 [Hirsutella minnesotensis 3608]